MMGKESRSLMPEVRFIFKFCIHQGSKSPPTSSKSSLCWKSRFSLQAPAKVRFEEWLGSPLQPLGSDLAKPAVGKCHQVSTPH